VTTGPSPVRPHGPAQTRTRGTLRTLLIGLTAVFSAALLALPAAADPIEQKRAQAQQVLAEVRDFDARLAKTIEAYNLANVKLDEIKDELRRNGKHLTLARGNLKVAHRVLAERVVTIYTSGGKQSTMEVLLSAESLDDVLDRLEAVDRVSEQDTRVLEQVVKFQQTVKRQRAELRRARAAQERLVAERAQQQRSIEARLAQRERMLTSIRGEIAKLQAQERERQVALRRQAERRLAAVQAPAAAPAAAADSGAVPMEATSSAPAPPAKYGGVVGIAMQYLGVPYVYGGSSPSGFDCSGFIMYVYAQVGVSLPHNAAMQYGLGTPVSKSELQPGDLVFFDGLGHNGMYIGGGQFIHAPHTGDVVKISSLNDSWYLQKWVGAKRIT
jgi:cell wall-associated NlpC family hydrolase